MSTANCNSLGWTTIATGPGTWALTASAKTYIFVGGAAPSDMTQGGNIALIGPQAVSVAVGARGLGTDGVGRAPDNANAADANAAQLVWNPLQITLEDDSSSIFGCSKGGGSVVTFV